jgi:hypothetical protein
MPVPQASLKWVNDELILILILIMFFNISALVAVAYELCVWGAFACVYG